MPTAEQVEIILEYQGPDVDGGTISLDDLVPVLQGFASAYGKVAAGKGFTTQHKLRLVAVRRGSANIVLDVWEMVKDNSQQLQAVGSIVAAAMAVLGTLLAVMKLKKHIQKKPYTTRIDGQIGGIQIINSQNVSLTVAPEVYNINHEGVIDQDLQKIVEPLQSGHIESSAIKVKSGTESIEERVALEEKYIFDVTATTTTSTREAWLTGQINSMTKSTNSGYLYLTDGTRVFYKIADEHPSRFYPLFAHGGLLKIRAIAHLDGNLKPVSLDIYDMVPLQGSLAFDVPLDGQTESNA